MLTHCCLRIFDSVVHRGSCRVRRIFPAVRVIPIRKDTLWRPLKFFLVETVEMTTTDKVFDVARWSSFTNAIRVVAWVRRFLVNISCENTCRSDDLSEEELSQSKVRLLKHSQQLAFGEELCIYYRKAVNFLKGPYRQVESLCRSRGNTKN